MMNIYTYCVPSFLLAILLSILLAVMKEKGIRFLYNIIVESVKQADFIRKTVFLFFVFLVLNRTVLGRNEWVNPWSDVIGPWGLLLEDGTVNIDFIENILLFIPLGVMYNCAFNRANVFKNWNQGFNVIVKTFLISFAFSLLIECSQLMFKIGVFQLSDLFCNTLGGTIGGIIYILVKKVVNLLKKIIAQYLNKRRNL